MEIMWTIEIKLKNLKIVGGYKGVKMDKILKSESLDGNFFFVKQNRMKE